MPWRHQGEETRRAKRVAPAPRVLSAALGPEGYRVPLDLSGATLTNLFPLQPSRNPPRLT
jgi:hypothetical protein